MADQLLWAGFKAIQHHNRKGISPAIYLPKWWLSSVKEEKPIVYVEIYPSRAVIYHPRHIPSKALQKLLDLGIKY